MWNLYIANQNAVPPKANDIDRADWAICRDVFASLRDIEQRLILARHSPDRLNRSTLFRDCYETIGLTEQTASLIINSIAETVATKRGLVAQRNHLDNTKRE